MEGGEREEIEGGDRRERGDPWEGGGGIGSIIVLMLCPRDFRLKYYHKKKWAIPL